MSVAGLCIGLNYPKTRMALRGCVHDAHTAAQSFKTHAPAGSQLRVIVDDGEGAIKGTKDEIWEGLNWLRATGATTLFFHFSGHGTYMSDDLASSDELDGRDEAIVASNGNIEDDALYKNFVAKLSADTTLYAIMDCCHSGTVLDLPWLFSIDPVVECTRTHKAQPACRAVAISGCKDVGVSADAYNREEDHYEGALTAALYGDILGSRSIAAMLTLPLGETLSTLHKTLFDKGFTQSPRISCTSPVNTDTRFGEWPALAPAAPTTTTEAPAPTPTTTSEAPAPTTVSTPSFAMYSPPSALYSDDEESSSSPVRPPIQSTQPLNPLIPEVDEYGPYTSSDTFRLYAW